MVLARMTRRERFSNTGVHLCLPLIYWSGGECRLRPIGACLVWLSFATSAPSERIFFSRWCGAKLQTKLIVTTRR